MTIHTLPTLDEVTERVCDYLNKHAINPEKLLAISKYMNNIYCNYQSLAYWLESRDDKAEERADEYKRDIIPQLADLYHAILA